MAVWENVHGQLADDAFPSCCLQCHWWCGFLRYLGPSSTEAPMTSSHALHAPTNTLMHIHISPAGCLRVRAANYLSPWRSWFATEGWCESADEILTLRKDGGWSGTPVGPRRTDIACLSEMLRPCALVQDAWVDGLECQPRKVGNCLMGQKNPLVNCLKWDAFN